MSKIIIDGHIIIIKNIDQKEFTKEGSLRGKILEILDQPNGPKDILMDFKEVQAAERSSLKDAKEIMDGVPFRRIAIYGGSPTVTMITNTVLRFITDNSKVKIFHNKASALEWLAKKPAKVSV